MAKRFWVFILITGLLAFSHQVRGQHKDSTKNFLSAGPGYSYYQLRNINMSPLLYKGHSLLANLGHYIHKGPFISEFDFNFWFGSIKPSINPARTLSAVNLVRFDLDYTILHSIKKWKNPGITAYVGGSWLNKNGIRIHNSYFNNAVDYDLISSLAVSGALKKSFRLLNLDFDLRYQLSLPFVNYSIVPGYVSSFPEKLATTSDRDLLTVLKSGKIRSFSEIQRFCSKLSIDYNMKNDNAIRFTYYWDFINNEVADPITPASQGFIISTLFDLSKP